MSSKAFGKSSSNLNAESTTSTSITVDYHFLDPFGTMGFVYLELHKVSDLENFKLSDDTPHPLSVRMLYSQELEGDDQTAVELYWSQYDASYRASVSAYENSYVFRDLEPDTSYQVVMARYAEDQEGEDPTRILEETTRVKTLSFENSLTISRVSTDSVFVTLRLESTDILLDPVDESDPDAVPAITGAKLRINNNATAEKDILTDLGRVTDGGKEFEITVSDGVSSLGATLQVELFSGTSTEPVLSGLQIANPQYTGGT